MKMKTVPITEATATQMRFFATMALGLEIAPNAKKSDIEAKVLKAGYDRDFIEYDEDEEVKNKAEPTKDDIASNPALNSNGDEIVGIQINIEDKPGGRDPVETGVNGVRLTIPRGNVYLIPYRYAHVIENAVRTVYQQERIAVDVAITSHNEPAFPFTIVRRNVSRAEYEAQQRRIQAEFRAGRAA